MEGGLELVSLPHFLHNFWGKILLLLYSIKFHFLIVFTSWDIGEYVYYNCLLTRLWRHEFWLQPYLSNQAVFPTWPKSHDKNVSLLRMKRAFQMKWKAFFIFFKELSMKQITQFFWEGETPTLSLDLLFS